MVFKKVNRFIIVNIIIVINLGMDYPPPPPPTPTTTYQSANGTAIAGRQRGAYRFLTATIPLNAFLGTAWIWFSLRSLKDRQTDRQAEGEDIGPEEFPQTH